MHYNLFLIAISLKKRVIKFLILILASSENKQTKKRLKKSDKALNDFFLAFFKIFDQYKTQEMCDRIISDDSFPEHMFLINMTQQMCDETVDSFFYQN